MSKILRQPIQLYKGEDRTIGIKWERNGYPVDITGYTFRADIKDSVGGTILFTLTSGGGGFSITDATNGEYEMSIAKENVDLITIPENSGVTFPFATVVFDIEADDGSNTKKVLIGTFQVYEEITTSG